MKFDQSVVNMLLDDMKKRNQNRSAIRKPFYIAVTGHRKMNASEKKHKRIMKQMRNGVALMVHILTDHLYVPREDLRFIHGVASGVDVTFGDCGIMMGIPVHMYFPFPYKIQSKRAKWRPFERKWVLEQVTKCEKIVEVCDRFYTYGYQKRNVAMVDNCDLLAMCYTRSRSGSGNCHRYARKKSVLSVDLLELGKMLPDDLTEGRVLELFKF